MLLSNELVLVKKLHAIIAVLVQDVLHITTLLQLLLLVVLGMPLLVDHLSILDHVGQLVLPFLLVAPGLAAPEWVNS